MDRVVTVRAAHPEDLSAVRRLRGEGLGRTLLAEAVAIARRAGCYKVQLLSNNARQGAHRFYGNLGFEPSAQGFRLYI